MRVAVAVVLGFLFGVTGNPWATAVLIPFIDSATAVLSWEGAAAVAQLPRAGTAATVVGALLAALALPALLACLGEAVRGGSGARTSATIALVATALGGLGAPDAPAGPYLIGALLLAALMAVAPGRWAGIPCGFWCAAVSGAWLSDVMHGTRWVQPAAQDLAASGAPASALWFLALGTASLAMLAASCALLVRHRAAWARTA